MRNKCCLTCVNRYHLGTGKVRCWHDPGCDVEPNSAGVYIFTEEQAKKSACDQYYHEIGDRRYAAMDYSDWMDTFHAELQDDLRKQYDEYRKMMENQCRTDELYIVSFQYDDVGGMLDELSLKYDNRADALKAAIRESKRPGNHGVQLRHEWHDNQYRRDEGEWIDWKKEAKDGQAV